MRLNDERKNGLLLGSITTIQAKAPICAALLLLYVTSQGLAQTCYQPPASIQNWWRFEEQSGTSLSDTIGGKTGTHVGGPTHVEIPITPATGKVGGALRFTGAAAGKNYVRVADNDQWAFGSDFTIELWAKFDNPRGSHGNPGDILVAHDEGPGETKKWWFAFGGSKLTFHINSPATGPQFFPNWVNWSPSTISEWYHLAVVRAGNSYTIFVNGAAQSPSATNNYVIPNANAPLAIGYGEGSNYMEGLLDEVTTYSSAVNQAQITGIYNAGSAGKCSGTFPANGLVSHWTADGNANDSHGNNHGVEETLTQTTYSSSHVPTGQAFRFDGSSDADCNRIIPLTSCRVSIQNPATNLALPSFTYSVWVYPTKVPDPIRSMRAFSTFGFLATSSAAAGALVSIDPEAHLLAGGSATKLVPRFDIYNNVGWYSVFDPIADADPGPGSGIPLNRWTHIALTVDDSTKELVGYVNGERLTHLQHWYWNTPFSGTFTGSVQYASPLRPYIGAEGDPDHSIIGHWIGELDEVAVWNRALSASDISAVYNLQRSQHPE